MNFSSLQREVKVILKPNKPVKGKQKETEDSRIDFQLTWDGDTSTSQSTVAETPTKEKNTRKKAKTTTATVTTVQIDSPEESITQQEIPGNTMLLEVKSVTLAMKLPGQKQVRTIS